MSTLNEVVIIVSFVQVLFKFIIDVTSFKESIYFESEGKDVFFGN